MTFFPMHQDNRTVLEILKNRAQTTPHRVLYQFLREGAVNEQLTYRVLDQKSQRVAIELLKMAEPGDRVVLLYTPGLEFISALIGCFYAGMIAVPWNPGQPLEKLIDDCQPRVILCDNKGLQKIQSSLEALGGTCCLRSTSQLETNELGQFEQVLASSTDTTAILQYTSGSTGSPRGVVITHKNILANASVIQAAFGHSPMSQQELGVCWLPFHHDMGLIGNVLYTLVSDIPCLFMAPTAFLQRPYRWLQAISQNKATCSGGPNFAYDYCVERITEQQKSQLDLSSWKVAYVGAEPVSPRTLNRFLKAFECCGFKEDSFSPCYGLAESTLMVSGSHKRRRPIIRTFAVNGNHYTSLSAESESLNEPSSDDSQLVSGSLHLQTLVGCGQAGANHEMIIVDPVTGAHCPESIAGEIWISGPSVTQGYWNTRIGCANPSLTKQNDHNPAHRTGDIGFIYQNELFISGRSKEVIVIRGQNHHPQDLEETARSAHDQLRPQSSAAFGVNVNEEERLVIVQELSSHWNNECLNNLERDIRNLIAKVHHVQIHDLVFINKGTLSKTSSGKIRRQECRREYLSGQLNIWKL